MWHNRLVKFFRFWRRVRFGGWFDLLYHANDNTSTGVMLKVGLGISLYVGWRVPEGQKFPFGFVFFLLDRVDFGDHYCLLSAGITVFGYDKQFAFGSVKSIEFR